MTPAVTIKSNTLDKIEVITWESVGMLLVYLEFCWPASINLANS